MSRCTFSSLAPPPGLPPSAVAPAGSAATPVATLAATAADACRCAEAEETEAEGGGTGVHTTEADWVYVCRLGEATPGLSPPAAGPEEPPPAPRRLCGGAIVALTWVALMLA